MIGRCICGEVITSMERCTHLVSHHRPIVIPRVVMFRVPDVVRITLNGNLKQGVMAKDAALYILGQLGADFAVYRVVEFSGPIVEAMPIEERTVLCNMAVEGAAKSAYVQPDRKTVDYIKSRTSADFTIYETDADYKYENEIVFNIGSLSPQVAVPHNVDNVRKVSEVEGIPIDQVFIGSCTGGKLNDLAAAADILKGKQIAGNTRLIINPGSKEVLEKSIELGYVQTFIDAGAAIFTPGCGACIGLHGGLLAAGEKCVSTANRNFPGRMGSPEAEIYLTSPVTAAATAIKGELTAEYP